MANCPWSPNASCNTELYSDPNSAFIIGSNSPDRREYIEMIKEVIREFNLEPNFALDLNIYNGKQAFCTHICSQIRKSKIIIADLSGSSIKCKETNILFSANVFWEYGYAAALEKDPIIIFDESQEIPFDVADKNTETYNMDSLKMLLRPVIKQRLNSPIPIIQNNSNNRDITDSKEIHKKIFRLLLKNYLIKYYYEVINPPKDPLTNTKVSILIDKLNDLGDSQVQYFKDANGSIQHQKIIGTYFGGDVRSFRDRINNSEIQIEGIKRDLPILAGDLALIFYDHYEESLIDQNNYLKFIRQDFESEVKKYEFLEENYNHDRFTNSLSILEKTYRLIQLYGPIWKDSDSATEWRIINPDKLEELIQKKSINNILRQTL
ncbi:hypothetical protein LCGC14_0663640 [marine sediment metagenome]|uniref:CD-NTase-associated protein 12/Pycsar effector protein TIR domain-containing protein n=1 Tax=marine sediment metagenome TaxID=412755 RepID=A0A0F9TE98_9ZZZZ